MRKSILILAALFLLPLAAIAQDDPKLAAERKAQALLEEATSLEEAAANLKAEAKALEEKAKTLKAAAKAQTADPDQVRQNNLEDVFEVFKADATADSGYYVGDRIYKFRDDKPKNNDTPEQIEAQDILDDSHERLYKILKCTKYDSRVFHLCPEADFFEANARVYFDNGRDEEDEVDLFKNGNLEPALQFAAVRIPWRFGKSEAFDPWSWGPELSAGLGTPAKAKEGEEGKSTAPIVLVSAGLRLTYKISAEGSNFAFEVGRVFGFTTDESFGDNDDSATYVGIKIKYVPPKSK